MAAECNAEGLFRVCEVILSTVLLLHYTDSKDPVQPFITTQLTMFGSQNISRETRSLYPGCHLERYYNGTLWLQSCFATKSGSNQNVPLVLDLSL